MRKISITINLGTRCYILLDDFSIFWTFWFGSQHVELEALIIPDIHINCQNPNWSRRLSFKLVTAYFDVRHYGDSENWSYSRRMEGYLNCPVTFFFSSLDNLSRFLLSYTRLQFTFLPKKMLFFRTISLVAALAFATLSSAVPVEGAALVSSGDVFARDASELALPVKRGNDDISDLYDTCHKNVEDIIIKISQYIFLLL